MDAIWIHANANTKKESVTMANNLQQPLNPQHCTTLDCVLKRAAELQQLIDKCTDCGLDTSAAQEEVNRQVQTATAIKRNFFPLSH